MLAHLPPLALLTYGLLLAAIVGLWLHPAVWIASFVLAVGAGYLANILSGPALVWIALLAGLCWLYRTRRAQAPSWRNTVVLLTAAAGLFALALLLGMHALPGFHNAVLARQLVLSEGAAPYTRYLNFDKTLVGLLLLGIVYQGLLRARATTRQALTSAYPWALANILVVVAAAYALGFVRFDPKWTSFFWAWAATNLFFTCVAEEALFRGFVQRELSGWLQARRRSDVPAVVASAVLFGLAHWAGGWRYVLLSTLAGLGYAWVFRRSGRIEMAILAHFALNAVHFLLLTYPRLAVPA